MRLVAFIRALPFVGFFFDGIEVKQNLDARAKKIYGGQSPIFTEVVAKSTSAQYGFCLTEMTKPALGGLRVDALGVISFRKTCGSICSTTRSCTSLDLDNSKVMAR